MQRYLTRKANPGTGTKLLENLALIVLLLLEGLCLYASVRVLLYGLQGAGMNASFLLPLIPAVLLVIPANAVTERIRARRHARMILEALVKEEEPVPLDELDQKSGVHRSAGVINQLINGGYVQELCVRQGFACLGDRGDQLPATEPVKPLFHDREE